jgi:pSer/pThr/pTyr-binding forkhead associated (FHA) protein
MQVTLTVTKGPARTRSIRLRAAETIIGRSRDCDVCIPSAEVSRRHCLLALSGSKLTVEDLTSANGTFLNDQRVTGIQTVQSGDQLRIGPLTFSIECQSTKSALATLDAMSQSSPVEQGLELIDVLPVELESANKPAQAKIPDELELEADSKLELPEGDDFQEFLRKMQK